MKLHLLRVTGVPESLKCAATRAAKVHDEFVKERRNQQPPNSLNAERTVSLVRNAREQTDLVEEGASWCMTSVQDLDDLLSDRPFGMLASGAALRRAARLWRQNTHDPSAELLLDSEQAPSELALAGTETYESLLALSATILDETLFLYEQAANLLHEYKPRGIRDGGFRLAGRQPVSPPS